MADAREDWWVIGSAAVALHGANPGPVGDIDVLLSVADARRILPKAGLGIQPGLADDRFRSAIFARWAAPPVPVEFMAGLDVCIGGQWQAVRPSSRIALAGVFTPDRAELAAILHSFGRDKDRRRAALLA